MINFQNNEEKILYRCVTDCNMKYVIVWLGNNDNNDERHMKDNVRR